MSKKKIDPVDVANVVKRQGATITQAEQHVERVNGYSTEENREYAEACAAKQLQLSADDAAKHVKSLDVAAIAKAGRNGDVETVRELLAEKPKKGK